MDGSRASVAGIVINDDKLPISVDQAGKDKEMKRV